MAGQSRERDATPTNETGRSRFGGNIVGSLGAVVLFIAFVFAGFTVLFVGFLVVRYSAALESKTPANPAEFRYGTRWFADDGFWLIGLIAISVALAGVTIFPIARSLVSRQRPSRNRQQLLAQSAWLLLGLVGIALAVRWNPTFRQDIEASRESEMISITSQRLFGASEREQIPIADVVGVEWRSSEIRSSDGPSWTFDRIALVLRDGTARQTVSTPSPGSSAAAVALASYLGIELVCRIEDDSGDVRIEMGCRYKPRIGGL